MPLVLTRSRHVFLHVPKTGGTWIRYALRCALVPWYDYGHQHADREESAEVFPDSPRFTVVRNPFAWYASYWAVKQIEGWERTWLPCDFDCMSDDFSAFVRAAALRHPGMLGRLYARFDGPGVKVLRCERLGFALHRYLLKAGEPFDERALRETPVLNRGASLPALAERIVWESATVAALVESEREAFERYGYSKVYL